MAIKITYNGATIVRPGVYSSVVVENLTGFPLLPAGTVGIIGEAIGGEPHVLDILTGTGIQDAKSRYKSGNIADALELLVNPSKDPRIANGASTVVVYKTNSGTQSALNLANDAGSPSTLLALTSKNWGYDENLDSIAIAQGQTVNTNAFIQGSIVGPYSYGNTDTLILICNGTTYTYTSSLSSGSHTASATIGDINTAGNWSSSLKPVIASIVGGAIKIVIDPTVVTAGQEEYGFIDVNPASTLDTIFGITGTNRGFKGSRIFTLNGASGVQEISPELGGIDQLQIQYTGSGTAATLSIGESGGAISLTTVISGASGDDLAITLQDSEGNNKQTLQTLADLISSSGVYTCTVLGPNPQANANQLDQYSGIAIKQVAANLRADNYAFANWFNVFSQYASAVVQNNVYYALAPISQTFFTGATDGTSANSDFSNGFLAMRQQVVDKVVPLISQDAGSLSIASINALALSHAEWGWSTLGRSEREVICSFSGTKAQLKSAAMTLNSGYAMMVGQEVQVENNEANLVYQDPWAAACIIAGMRAGADVGEPLTNKVINVNNIKVPNGDWDPKSDFDELAEAGVTVLQALDSGGFKIVLGNTTYSTDGSFVWNRESVVQVVGYIAYDLRQNLELTFIGTKAKTGSATAIANFIKARMTTYLNADLIVGDDLNKGLGYSNLGVVVEGDTAVVNLSITPVQGLDFILPTIYLANIQQTA